MRTYWNTSNGLRTIEEWQPGCWVQVTCPTEEDVKFLEQTLHIPDYYIGDIADVVIGNVECLFQKFNVFLGGAGHLHPAAGLPFFNGTQTIRSVPVCSHRLFSSSV